MNTYPDLVEIVRKKNAERRALKDTKIATHRVDVALEEQLRLTASIGGFSFRIDEPAERGGTEAGPPPLAHFLAGAATCLLTQFQKVALEMGVVIDSMKALVRGHFDRRLGGGFKDIVYDLEIRSEATPQAIREISRQAELMCYAHNTLRKCVRMKTNLRLNGETLILGE